MHWLKTKIKHILYNNFTDREFTKFMKIRALTCQLGEIPKDYQIATVCPQKTYQMITKKIQNEGQTLREVLQKDIEDASEVEEKREYWKIKKRQQREKYNDVPKDSPRQSPLRLDKIKLDKIRLDKNKYKKEIFPYIDDNYYDIFLDWLEYKADRKEIYKNDKSIKALYDKLIKLSNSKPNNARIIIDDAMANNYAGFFELKNNKSGGQKTFKQIDQDREKQVIANFLNKED